MNKRFSVCIVVYLLILTVFPAAAQDAPASQGGWTTGAPMPTRPPDAPGHPAARPAP